MTTRQARTPLRIPINPKVKAAPPAGVRRSPPAPSLAGPLHLAGIGGCGMSGLARILLTQQTSHTGEHGQVTVTGSDSVMGETVDALRAEGFSVRPEAEQRTLPDECRTLVCSAAIKPDHPLVLDAERRGVAVVNYAEALGLLMAERTGVAIAGTHGKSTTSAMLGCVLADTGLDPSVIVGAQCGQLQGGSLGSAVFSKPAGFRVGASEVPIGPYAGRPGLLIAEACEFNRSFHNLRPTIGAVTNVEADHLDYYGSLDAVVEAFRGFAQRVAPADAGGRLLIAHEGAHRIEVAAAASALVETIGFHPSATWRVAFDASTRTVHLSHADFGRASWHLRLPGQHNAMNSAFAAAIAIAAGADPETVGRSLSAFRGVERRCQMLGERPVGQPDGAVGTVRVYDDYGHHPTEVDATLRALRDFERPQDRGGRLICVFQPHQHSRTRHLLDEFAGAFSQADVVIVPNIYFVRDSQVEQHKVTAGDLVDRLRNRGVRAMHLYPFEAIVEQLENLCQPGDLLVVMGAGPVWEVARDYMALADT